jgi:hypothetical protein
MATNYQTAAARGTPRSDPRLRTPMLLTDLVTIEEIAKMPPVHVKRETVDGWRRRDKDGRKEANPMPAPVLPLEGQNARTPYWDRKAISAWLHATGRMSPAGRNPHPDRQPTG